MNYELYELLDKSFSKGKFNRFGPGVTTLYAIFLNFQLAYLSFLLIFANQNNSVVNYGPIALPIAIGMVRTNIGKRSYSSVG